MKFFATAIFLAAAATAAPWGSGGGGSGGSTSTCDSSEQQVCCDGILGCAVSILGSGCNGGSYCCSTESPIVSRPHPLYKQGLLLKYVLGCSHQHQPP